MMPLKKLVFRYLKRLNHFGAPHFNQSRNFDARYVWVCWFILLAIHKITINFDKLTTKNASMCNIFLINYITLL